MELVNFYLISLCTCCVNEQSQLKKRSSLDPRIPLDLEKISHRICRASTYYSLDLSAAIDLGLFIQYHRISPLIARWINSKKLKNVGNRKRLLQFICTGSTYTQVHIKSKSIRSINSSIEHWFTTRITRSNLKTSGPCIASGLPCCRASRSLWLLTPIERQRRCGRFSINTIQQQSHKQTG